MLIRHPDMFYVSLKGDRDSVFLREAYHNSQLIENDKLLLIKEKLRALVNVPRFPGRNVPTADADEAADTEAKDGTGEHKEDEWSDIDNLASDGFDDDDDEENEDDWSDEEDDMPPDFSDDDTIVDIELSKPEKQANGSKTSNEKVLAPVFPDGRPRECW
ncbi:unnamed protein product [Fraxinus pennsylvanica]|uniref:PORR domain-containing protein n=1 Tax=Fraxinus pennsylvanica TaxID=56036 RepID=A0AAD1ZR19_9LAMI|nr:unnamed protein product [Fraxinus pennsylvanica]